MMSGRLALRHLRRPLAVSTRAHSTLAAHWPKWPRQYIQLQQPATPGPDGLPLDPAIDSALMSPPTIIASTVDALHIVTGSSWLAAGVAVTLALRLALLPTSLRATLLQTVLRTIAPEAMLRFRYARDALLSRDRESLRFWVSSIKLLNFDHQRALLPINHLFHPALLVATVASNIWATRYLCQMMPSMHNERFLWIRDFTLASIDADPSLTLPLICTSVQFASLAVAAWPMLRSPPQQTDPTPTKASAVQPTAAVPPGNRVVKAVIGVSFGFNILFAIISPYFPQGVLLMHWLPSSLFGLAHMLAMRFIGKLPAFRKWVTSRQSIVYAQAAAQFWKKNPLRALDFEQLKKRPTRFAVQQPKK